MKRLSLVLATVLLVAFAAQAEEGWVARESPRSVADTVDRLEQAVRDRGLSVFGRIDHAKAAAAAGLELRPTTVLLFGSPKLGTKLMQVNQTIGVDLPLRALVWEDDRGKVWLGYVSPSALLQRHGIENQQEVEKKMATALAGLAQIATSP